MLHVFDGANDIAAFILREQRMAFAFQKADVRVVPDDYIEIAVG